MATIFVYIGDTAPDVADTLLEQKSNGSIGPIDLTGVVTLDLQLRSLFNPALLIDKPGVVLDAPNGKVVYDWDLSDTTTAIDSSPGPYLAWWRLDFGGGTVITTPPFDVFFLDHYMTRREVGPCTPWCTSADVIAGDSSVVPGANLSSAIKMASEVLYEMSGRTFDGWCQSVIRPCQDTGCWGGGGWIGGPQILDRGHIVWSGQGWYRNDEPCQCGGWLQKIRLPGIAQAVVKVLIGGVELDPSKYRLDPDSTLIRTDGSYWPLCQNLAAADDAVGAFTIVYQHGYAPNESAKRAAAQLAREFYLALSGGACSLPSGVVEIVRQGIKVTRAASLFRDGATGLSMVDSFLAAYGACEPTYIFSPDTYPTSRRTQ